MRDGTDIHRHLRARAARLVDPPFGQVYEGAMRRENVRSTSLESIGFDPGTNLLEIEFRTGDVYRYSVPRRVHRELMSAESHGAYFARSIRWQYRGWKVDR
jgi:KTSC domain